MGDSSLESQVELTDAIMTGIDHSVDSFDNQCKFMVRGLRRCRNSATVNTKEQLCSYHDPANVFTENIKNTKKTARISSSHKRMTRPDSVINPPEKIASFDPTSPIILDIGCARGLWLENLQHKFKNKFNYIGVELREELVSAAAKRNHFKEKIHFRCMNCQKPSHWCSLLGIDFDQLNNSVKQLESRTKIANMNTIKNTTSGIAEHLEFDSELFINALQGKCIKLICIQFPDPWAKSRHRKRRLVDDGFATILHNVVQLWNHQSEESFVYVSSDREDLHEEMVQAFNEKELYRCIGYRIPGHPLGIGTERDLVCEHLHREVYRSIFKVL